MVDITLRGTKGSPLTHTEVDDNFNNLKTAVEANVTDIADAGGVTVYATIDDLPLSSLTAGDLAYVTATNRLYLSNGTGWYNIALVNSTPTISGQSATYKLANDGTATTVTLTGTDAEGIPLTWSATTSGDTDAATVTNVDNVFTITPSTDTDDAGTITVTFRASDGINIGTASSEFSLAFVHALWADVALSVGTSSTNSLDNSTFIDRSSNAHTVTTSGSPEQTAFHPYLENWSVDFDGSGDYLSFPADTSHDLGTGDFTFETWFNIPNVSGRKYILGPGATTASHYDGIGVEIWDDEVAVWASSNGTSWDIYQCDTASNRGSGTVSAGVWNHLAFVRNGTSFKAYLNGVEQISFTSSASIAYQASNPYNIGRSGYNSGTFYFTGYISNTRLVKGTAVYTSAFTPPTEKLTAVSGTSLLTCQSNRFIDNSTNDHTITPNGDPKIASFNPFGQESEYAAGENKGTFVTTNGDTNLLTISHDTSLNLYAGDYTVEFWVWLDGYSTSGNVISKGGNTSREWGFALTSTTITAYWSTNGSSSGDTLISATGLTNNLYEWIHITYVKSGSTVKIYKNGEQVASGTFTSIYSGTGTAKVARFMDYTGISHSLVGKISDLKLIKGTAVYTSDFTPPTSPVGNTNADLYLPMDNAGVFDKTGNHDLTLSGDTATSTTQTKFADTSMYFDGADDYLFSNQEIFLGAGDWTIEFWVYPTSSAVSHYVDFRDGSNSGNQAVPTIYYSSGLKYYTSGSDRISGGSISANQWTHIAVCKSSNVTKMFINGTQTGSNFADTVNYVSEQFSFGIYRGNNQGDFTGYLENLQVLTGIAKYTSNFTVPTSEQGRTYQAED